MLENGDVIFSKDGSLGNPALISDLNTLATINATMMLVRVNETIEPSFFYQIMKGEQFERLIHLKVSGSSIPHLFQADMNEFTFHTPEKEEQTKIGVFLKQLDDTIALHQQELDTLKQTKQGFLQKMFPQKSKSIPEIRFPGFTGDWEQRKLGEMLKEFSVRSKTEDEYTVLSSTNSGMEIRSGRVTSTSNIGYKTIEDGDLVLSPQNLWLGNINVNDIGKGLVSPSYKTFKFVDLDRQFSEPQIRLPRMLEEYKNASTQGASVVRRNLELESFYQIPIKVPSMKEQEKVGSFFKTLDDTITLHQRELETLNQTKKAFLQKMFI